MAEHLASIFGTEKDRVNCPFYFKIGVCRHGDRCSRLHNRPTASQTLLLANMYQSPDAGFHGGVDQHGNIQQFDPRKLQEHFEDFYEDIFEELSKHGEIENLNVCDNLADHMIGNVYVKFHEEEHAAAALNSLNGRFYAGRPMVCDFSPVTDFREATCRQYEENTCNRGGYCNFMHLKKISRELRRKLFGSYRRRSRSRSHSPYGRGEARGPPSPRRFGDRDFFEPRRGRGGGRGFGGRGIGRRSSDFEWDDRRNDDRRGGGGGPWRRRARSRSRSRSPAQRRPARSPSREGSAERRAKIEQWNREREERQAAAVATPDQAPGFAPLASMDSLGYSAVPSTPGGHGFPPATSAAAGGHGFPPVPSAATGGHGFPPVTSAAAGVHGFPPVTSAAAGVHGFPPATSAAAGNHGFPPATSVAGGLGFPTAPSAGSHGFPTVPSAGCHGFPPVPSAVGTHGFPQVPSAAGGLGFPTVPSAGVLHGFPIPSESAYGFPTQLQN